MTDVAHVDARLNSLFEPGFVSQDRVLMDAKGVEATPGVLREAPAVTIRDGRKLQGRAEADGSFTEAGFFDEHSFVLLDHFSGVRNWDSDPAVAPEETDIARIYFPEISKVIRERLFPDHRLEIPKERYLLRRGPDTPNPFYGTVVHQDYGLSADDYEENVAAYGTDEAAEAWRRQYDRDEVVGFLVINFWRTVYMDEPLRHEPLTICDPYTVEPDDVVSTGLVNFTPTGRPSNQLGMRYNPEQRWYYYPVRRERRTSVQATESEAEMPKMRKLVTHAKLPFAPAWREASTTPFRMSRRLGRRGAGEPGSSAWYRWRQPVQQAAETDDMSGDAACVCHCESAPDQAGVVQVVRTRVGRSEAVPPLGETAIHNPERRQAYPVEQRPCEAKNRKAKRNASPKSRSAEKLSEQLSRRRIISRRSGTGCAANRSLRAVHRWQRRCAERPDNVPPRKRPGIREDAGGFCQLQGG